MDNLARSYIGGAEVSRRRTRPRLAIVSPHAPLSISVVICAYTEDRWDNLVDAVRSVAAQTRPVLETIVVIDHNSSLLEKVKAAFPAAVVVKNSESRGLSGARNSGVAMARGQVIAFLDDDAVAETEWLESLCEHYAAPDVLGVGGSIEPKWGGKAPRSFPSEFGWVVGCSYRGMPQSASLVRNMIGANMSFRRDIFDEVGGFLNGIGRVGKLPLGCEETELCIRVQRHRPEAKFIYEPRARVWHHVPRARARWSYFTSRCFAEGMSKAIVSSIAGARNALSTEKSYALLTLPSGFARGLAQTIKGDISGIGRSTAILVGLLATTIGYCVGRASRFRNGVVVPIAEHREPHSSAVDGLTPSGDARQVARS
jgi:GT2 family glycosyltransferase